MLIGRLQKVPVREVWKNEEKDFTPWLEENLDILGDSIGFNLSIIEREKRVGRYFEVDILAEDPSGNYVIIENQFGKSDHDHLGKLLTYMINLGAKTAIWICENPKPEHIQVINWLNEISPQDTSFYLIKLEVFKIEESPPAPYFSVIVKPTEELKEVGKEKTELVSIRIGNIRREFWSSLLKKIKSRHIKLFSTISPSNDNWISTGAGITGLSYYYVILMDSARIELYIDTGNKERNKEIFDRFYAEKEDIEREFGDELEWRRLDEKRSSKITKTVINKGLRDEESWDEIQDKMIDAMIRLEAAFRNRIMKLKYI
mgnify:CR=1 FL=1